MHRQPVGLPLYPFIPQCDAPLSHTRRLASMQPPVHHVALPGRQKGACQLALPSSTLYHVLGFNAGPCTQLCNMHKDACQLALFSSTVYQTSCSTSLAQRCTLYYHTNGGGGGGAAIASSSGGARVSSLRPCQSKPLNHSAPITHARLQRSHLYATLQQETRRLTAGAVLQHTVSHQLQHGSHFQCAALCIVTPQAVAAVVRLPPVQVAPGFCPAGPASQSRETSQRPFG
jgi:hypothetical protein